MHGTRYLYGASGIANLALAAEESQVGDSLVQQWSTLMGVLGS